LCLGVMNTFHLMLRRGLSGTQRMTSRGTYPPSLSSSGTLRGASSGFSSMGPCLSLKEPVRFLIFSFSQSPQYLPHLLATSRRCVLSLCSLLLPHYHGLGPRELFQLVIDDKGEEGTHPINEPGSDHTIGWFMTSGLLTPSDILQVLDRKRGKGFDPFS